MTLRNHNCRDLFAYRPERLVVLGFRCTMAGYDLGDPECWNCLWDIYVAEVGVATTRRLMGELQYWVRGVRSTADAPLTYYPMDGCHVCRDECLLLSLLSSRQQKDGGCANYAISALLDAGEVLLHVPFQVLHTIAETPAHGKLPSPAPLHS